MSRSRFYYDGHYLKVAEQIKEHINSSPEFLSQYTSGSTRAAGDALEALIAEKFDTFLGDWCGEYSKNFARRAMADVAFTDTESFYNVVDVKTHREDTKFNMPNLTSVDRLARFYESDMNVFALILVKYNVEGTQVVASEVTFAPIEFLDWDCLTIGALGWGQIQIANSNRIGINDKFSRKEWMIQLCDAMMEFYPKEIQKIQDRVKRFEKVKQHWERRDDIWS